LLYNGTLRIIENRPYFGTIVDGEPMFVGLFSDGFQLGRLIGDAWQSVERVFLKDASTDDATGEMRMEWTRKLNYLEQMVDPD